MSIYLPKRDELSFLPVFALPNDSRITLVLKYWWIRSIIRRLIHREKAYLLSQWFTKFSMLGPTFICLATNYFLPVCVSNFTVFIYWLMWCYSLYMLYIRLSYLPQQYRTNSFNFRLCRRFGHCCQVLHNNFRGLSFSRSRFTSDYNTGISSLSFDCPVDGIC